MYPAGPSAEICRDSCFRFTSIEKTKIRKQFKRVREERATSGTIRSIGTQLADSIRAKVEALRTQIGAVYSRGIKFEAQVSLKQMK
ncbi:MAG: hypothetical protein PHV51_05920 [Methanosarcinaceae archaeon]|nr:hypothetical protein [Methanosarcinaceae archaeon]MDD4497672.1 hypothetical protein [Methanosarcinaceae archaeon]